MAWKMFCLKAYLQIVPATTTHPYTSTWQVAKCKPSDLEADVTLFHIVRVSVLDTVTNAGLQKA